MPGMMDTVLNIGLNDETANGMSAITRDERFVYDIYRRLIQMFGSVVMGIPDEAFEAVISVARQKADVDTDAELTAADWESNSFSQHLPSETELSSRLLDSAGELGKTEKGVLHSGVGETNREGLGSKTPPDTPSS